jgi:hypothetical protein
LATWQTDWGFLSFVYTSDVGLVFSPSDAISIEIFLSFQIAIAGDSDNI